MLSLKKAKEKQKQRANSITTGEDPTQEPFDRRARRPIKAAAAALAQVPRARVHAAEGGRGKPLCLTLGARAPSTSVSVCQGGSAGIAAARRWSEADTMPGGATGARAAGARAALAPAAAGAGGSGERAAPAAPAARGGTGKRRRGEADAGGAPAGGAAQKKPRGVCPHNRERSHCKECGGSAFCQHQRKRSTCKECGGASICQHQRIRSRCKECREEADTSMPAGLEELEEAGV